jgi:alpha-ketoglutarate-dependent taurine dioxygenase
MRDTISQGPLSPFGVDIRSNESGADIGALPVAQITEWVAAHRVVVFRGFAPLVGERFPAFAGELGTILEWDFGAVNNLVVKPDAKNYLFTNSAVPFHWDGAFVGRIPHYIVFQCDTAPPSGTGGETLFTDTVRLLEQVPPEERAVWEGVKITYSTEKIVHYGGSFTSPLLAKHPATGETVLRFAEPVNDLNPVTLEIEGVPGDQHQTLLTRLHDLLYAPDQCLALTWEDGDIVIADNHATLHGRTAFTQAEKRHIRRVNVL